jgi:hypothetical protein
MAVNILNPQERERLSTTPLEISDAELVRFFTLQQAALALFDPRVSPSHHLDQAAHICLLRWLGWSPVRVDRLPRTAFVALCEQLRIRVPDDLEPPSPRTSRLHAQRAREYLGWHKYTDTLERSLGEWLKPLAEEYDRSSVLLDVLLRHLYQERVVRPGLTRLERLVEAVRVAVAKEIAQTINSQLTAEQKRQMDDLVVVPTGETRSPLQRFKETPSKASRPQLLAVLEKIESIRAIGLESIDLSSTHPNRVKLMALRARRRENWSTARLKPEHRYPLLTCFLAHPAVVVVGFQPQGYRRGCAAVKCSLSRYPNLPDQRKRV